jgi:hypothetical protein
MKYNTHRNKLKPALFTAFLLFSLLTPPFAQTPPKNAIQGVLPLKEIQTINQVTNEYNLQDKERTLLFVIRIIENGETPKEFGVLVPQAMRYPDNPEKSFVTQCRWAAGTIKKRYNGNLKAFADRWCPIGAENDPTGLNKNFYGNTLFWMEKLSNENL